MSPTPQERAIVDRAEDIRGQILSATQRNIERQLDNLARALESGSISEREHDEEVDALIRETNRRGF